MTIKTMRLVVVAGAGASRNLGRDGRPMPLMNDWAATLRESLNDEKSGLADAARLEEGLSPTDFEARIGDLLRLVSLMDLIEQYGALGHAEVRGTDSHVAEWFKNIRQHGSMFRTTLNEVLFDLFRADRIDPQGAKAAYQQLLDRMSADEISLVCATTNYDPAIEMALDGLGKRPNDGAQRDVVGRTPSLDPEGLVDWENDHGGYTPVLHLHGAQGWYRNKSGEVLAHGQDLAFNPTLGTPALMYPDPEKDPFEDPALKAIWDEFEKALAGATHILVIGHSLHDVPLVEALNTVDGYMTYEKRLGIGVYEDVPSESDFQPVPDELKREIKDKCEWGIPVRTCFGPDVIMSSSDIRSWERY